MSGSIQPAPTGTMSISNGMFGVFPITYGLYPPEGSRVIAAQYDWTARTAYLEDLGQLVARGIQTAIQSAYFDNSSSAQYVTLVVGGTGQVLVLPPSAQGVFPLFFTGTPYYTISVLASAPAVTRLMLMNVPPNSVGTWQA